MKEGVGVEKLFTKSFLFRKKLLHVIAAPPFPAILKEAMWRLPIGVDGDKLVAPWASAQMARMICNIAGGKMNMRLSKSIVGEREADAARQVICGDGYLGMGKFTRDFELELAAYLGVEPWQVISVNSGTAALHLAVQSILIQEREKGNPRLESGEPEIIVPTLTFVASFQAISAAGCRPVACDILESTGTIDLEDAQKRITRHTLGMMHVDYASNPWHLDEVYAFAASNGLRMVDDAAHAFGCRHHGRKIGSFGDLVCFSFDGIKNITCGEGGCIVAFNKEAAGLIADSRLLGVAGDTAKRFSGDRSWDPDVIHQGWRYHLSNIMAAIGSSQLARLEDEFIPARRALYKEYGQLLGNIPYIVLLETDPDDFIVPHIMPVRVAGGKRELVQAALEKEGIPFGMHYKPNHLLTMFGGGRPVLPNSEKLYAQLLTLPLHPGLSVADVEFVCSTIKKALA